MPDPNAAYTRTSIRAETSLSDEIPKQLEWSLRNGEDTHREAVQDEGHCFTKILPEACGDTL